MVLDRPWRFQEVEAPRFSRHLAHEVGKVVSPMQWSPLLPRKYSWYSFLLETESTPGPYCGQKVSVCKSDSLPLYCLSKCFEHHNTGPMTEALCHVTNWLPCYYHLMWVTYLLFALTDISSSSSCVTITDKKGLYILQYRCHSHEFLHSFMIRVSGGGIQKKPHCKTLHQNKNATTA